jgi:hypothetical protein
MAATQFRRLISYPASSRAFAIASDTTALATCRPGRKDALGRTKRLPQRGGHNAVKPGTLIPRPHLSTKATTSFDCSGTRPPVSLSRDKASQKRLMTTDARSGCWFGVGWLPCLPPTSSAASNHRNPRQQQRWLSGRGGRIGVVLAAQRHFWSDRQNAAPVVATAPRVTTDG